MNKIKYFLLASLIFSLNARAATSDTTLCTHKIVLDNEGKLLSWMMPQSNAYDKFLRLRWDFIKTNVPNSPGPAPRSNYPQYYFYCAFVSNKGKLEPDMWMNDIAEKIPNWFENARLFYAYSGDESIMKLMKEFIDYTLVHGTSPADFAWPNFPYTTTNAGDTVFRGFTTAKRFVLHEIQVDHAGEMGLTYYRMYLYTGDKKYLTAAINVADVLAKNARKGTASQSVWPYRVIMNTGTITANYGANWTGCYMLLDNLIKANLGNVKAYVKAKQLAKEFLLQFPMKTGYWTDGHTDTNIKRIDYKSNLSASNMKLCLFDYPELDPDWKTNIPKLIKWTEDMFVFRCAPVNGNIIVDLKATPNTPAEPPLMYGASIVGEQDSFIFKMDYQTARYGAECARWYAMSGDETYKDKAFRSLNFVTYCNDSTGKAFESPFSKGINSWWSDCYGECPRMFYQAFAGVPEWAPPAENHILYSEGILTNLVYANNKVEYTATGPSGIEYLRLAFKPTKITVNGKPIPMLKILNNEGYSLRSLGNDDYAITIKRVKAGRVNVKGSPEK